MLRVLQPLNIDTSTLAWKQATKTKAIFARPVNTLVNDIHFFSKLNLITYEGSQAIKEGSIICTGLSKTDPWQQSPKKLLDKYVVTDITPDGWLYCEPKPDNLVNFCQIDTTFFPPKWCDATQSTYDADPYFQIYAKWGSEVFPDGVNKKYIQSGELNDYICQSIVDPADVWIVKKKFFDATYQPQ